jgi:hypothetical protein
VGFKSPKMLNTRKPHNCYNERGYFNSGRGSAWLERLVRDQSPISHKLLNRRHMPVSTLSQLGYSSGYVYVGHGGACNEDTKARTPDLESESFHYFDQ